MVALLEARGVTRAYSRGRWRKTGEVLALRQVDLTLRAGESLALVGESGGGKTTLARVLLGLLPPTSGEVWYGGLGKPVRLPFRSPAEWRSYRQRVQLVSQDAEAALDPEMAVGSAIEEGYLVQHPELPAGRRHELVGHLLEELGLEQHLAGRLPRALSGGEKRRVVIARAFAALGYGCALSDGQRVLVADEPTAGLDAVVRERVLRFFETQRHTLGISYLLISHDLATVERFADRLVMMYGGQVVEVGRAADALARPLHPYTRQLLAAGELAGDLSEMSEGDLELQRSSGCGFLLGCRDARKDARCNETPPLSMGGIEHRARCWFAQGS